MLTKNKILLSAMTVAGLLFSGCSESIYCGVTNGYVTKGAIQYAKVCVDSNFNYKCDDNETSVRTDKNGFYSFNALFPYPIVAVLDEKSFDTSLQKSYNLVLFTPASTDSRRDLTIFTSLVSFAMRDHNTTREGALKIVSKKLDVNASHIETSFIHNNELTQEEKDKLETASSQTLQLLERTFTSVNSVSDTNLTLTNHSAEVTASFVDTFFENDDTLFLNLDTNATKVQDIVNSIIRRLPVTLIKDSKKSPETVKADATKVNNANNNTLSITKAVVVPENQEELYKELFLVPPIDLLDESDTFGNSDSITNFKIDAYREDIANNERNISISLTLNTVDSNITLPFTQTLYAKTLDLDTAVAIAFNTNLGDDRLVAGDYFTVSRKGTNEVFVEYWGLANAKRICDTKNAAIISSVQAVNFNTLTCP